MSLNGESTTIVLNAPPDYACANCMTLFNNEANGGPVNEIHIYTSNNEFEKSVSVLEALTEVFGSSYLSVALASNFNLLMCAKCAEVVSLLFKDFLNLTQLSSESGYLAKLVVQIESWHNKYSLQKEQEVEVVDEDIFNESIVDVSEGGVTFHYEGVEEEEEEDGSGDVESNVVVGGEEDEEDEDGDYEEDSIGDLSDASTESKKKEKLRKKLALNRKKFKRRMLPNEKKSSGYLGHSYNSPSSSPPKGGSKTLTSCRNIYARRLFVCSACPEKFAQNWELHQHNFMAHQGREMDKCGGCDFRYYGEIMNIETHKCLTDEEKNRVMETHPIICEICGIRFRVERMLKFHQEKVHVRPEIRFTCIRCDKQIADRTKLFEHMEIHADTKSYLCGTCGSCFAQKSGLKKHILSAHQGSGDGGEFGELSSEFGLGESGLVKCLYCEREFEDRATYGAHLREVHQKVKKEVGGSEGGGGGGGGGESEVVEVDEKGIPIIGAQFPCEQCGRVFDKMRNLRGHEKYKHSCKDAMKHECSICTKKFFSQTKLNVHMESHTRKLRDREPEALYICTLCSVSFKYKTFMELHLASVHNQRVDSLECDICGNPELESRVLLIKHKRSHMTPEEKKAAVFDLSCDKCGNVYDSWKGLDSHYMYAHSDNKTKCPICDRELRTKNLESHVKLHEKRDGISTDWTPPPKKKIRGPPIPPDQLVCDICNNGFVYKSRKTLVEHKLIHNGGHKRVHCPDCGMGVRNNSTLIVHRLTHLNKNSSMRRKAGLNASPKTPSSEPKIKTEIVTIEGFVTEDGEVLTRDMVLDGNTLTLTTPPDSLISGEETKNIRIVGQVLSADSKAEKTYSKLPILRLVDPSTDGGTKTVSVTPIERKIGGGPAPAGFRCDSCNTGKLYPSKEMLLEHKRIEHSGGEKKSGEETESSGGEKSGDGDSGESGENEGEGGEPEEEEGEESGEMDGEEAGENGEESGDMSAGEGDEGESGTESSMLVVSVRSPAPPSPGKKGQGRSSPGKGVGSSPEKGGEERGETITGDKEDDGIIILEESSTNISTSGITVEILPSSPSKASQSNEERSPTPSPEKRHFTRRNPKKNSLYDDFVDPSSVVKNIKKEDEGVGEGEGVVKVRRKPGPKKRTLPKDEDGVEEDKTPKKLSKKGEDEEGGGESEGGDEEGEFLCILCPPGASSRNFISERALKLHVKVSHGEDEETEERGEEEPKEIDGEESSSTTNSNNVTKKQEHSCSECGNNFKTKAALVLHSKVHTKNKSEKEKEKVDKVDKIGERVSRSSSKIAVQQPPSSPTPPTTRRSSLR